MYGTLRDDLVGTLAEVREAGLYKSELEITTPQGAHVDVTGQGELLNLCANNYLGLANHPEIVAEKPSRVCVGPAPKAPSNTVLQGLTGPALR